VTVNAVDDDTPEESSHTGTITLSSSDTNNDDKYNILGDQEVTVFVMDNDMLIVTESDGSTAVTEGGATDTFTAVLSSAPTDDVVITFASTADVTTTPATITFTAANWNTAQTVTSTAVDDDLDEDVENATITLSVASDEFAFNALADQTVTVAVTDNDTAGFTVSAISGNTTEAGGTATFTVVLD